MTPLRGHMPVRGSSLDSETLKGRNTRRGAIPLRRYPNFRDIGGVAAGAGRLVRPGRFYRAPALNDLDETEEAFLCEVDPAVIVDFRSPDEVRSQPVSMPRRLAGRQLPLPIPPLVDASFRTLFERDPIERAAVAAAMEERYRDFVRVHAEVYARFLSAIANAGERAVIFHCTAGKDRTGFASALVLAALGAPDEEVERDYLASGELWRPDSALEALFPREARDVVLGVSPAYLRAGLSELEAAHGGAAAFAEAALGGARAYGAWRGRNVD
jgi:protein-tyrosine phosphatase